LNKDILLIILILSFAAVSSLTAASNIVPIAYVNAQNVSDTALKANNNNTLGTQLTYVLIFNYRTIGNIDNETKIVSSIVGTNPDKIREEFVEEISLQPSVKLKQEIDSIIDEASKARAQNKFGIVCDTTIMTETGMIINLQCIVSQDKLLWFISSS
jgi:hypothetical protein